MKISRETPIYQVLQNYPQAIDIFIKHGMGCHSCLGAATESIENGSRMHGIDIELLLNELRQLIKEQDVEEGDRK